jgi:hypothetical protein
MVQIMCFSNNTPPQKTGKPTVKLTLWSCGLQHYVVQSVDTNLSMEYHAFVCPAEVKMEVAHLSEMFGIHLPDYMVS